jgi:hypothetical protein
VLRWVLVTAHLTHPAAFRGRGISSGGGQGKAACRNGTGSGGLGISAGYNLDLGGAAVAGVSSTGGGLFHIKAGETGWLVGRRLGPPLGFPVLLTSL